MNNFFLNNVPLLGFWFWCIIAVATIILALLAHQDEPLLGWATIVAALAFLPLYPAISVFFGLTAKGWLAVGGCYILAGMVWSLFKWRLRISEVKDALTTLQAERTAYAGKGSENEADEQSFFRGISRRAETLMDMITFEKNKKRISMWITFWPWQAVSQGIYDAVQFAMNSIKRIYKRMAGNTLAELNKFKV